MLTRCHTVVDDLCRTLFSLLWVPLLPVRLCLCVCWRLLQVLRKGMCVKNWRFLRSGHVWGDDIILDLLDRRSLMDHAQAVALTYVEVCAHTLTRAPPSHVIHAHPPDHPSHTRCARTPLHLSTHTLFSIGVLVHRHSAVSAM